MTKNKLGLTDHPCIYPTPMIERAIKMTTKEGDVVLDPFLGSGTTLVAAEKLNRTGLGIELDDRYENIILKRVQNEANPELF